MVMAVARVRHARIVVWLPGLWHLWSVEAICGLYLLFGVGGCGRVMVVDHLRQGRQG